MTTPAHPEADAERDKAEKAALKVTHGCEHMAHPECIEGRAEYRKDGMRLVNSTACAICISRALAGRRLAAAEALLREALTAVEDMDLHSEFDFHLCGEDCDSPCLEAVEQTDAANVFMGARKLAVRIKKHLDPRL
jgi:hypothetical protein